MMIQFTNRRSEAVYRLRMLSSAFFAALRSFEFCRAFKKLTVLFMVFMASWEAPAQRQAVSCSVGTCQEKQ